MMSFIQTNLARTNQRYLNYYHGRNDRSMVRSVFNNSIITQGVICIILCGGLLACTEFVFNHLIDIAPERIYEAKQVYLIMLVSLFFNLLSTPFYAVLIAHENIVYSSIVQTGDALLKLPIAISLYYISSDKLVAYTWMMCGVTILNFGCYAIFSVKKYAECKHISLSLFNWKLTKEMFGFMIWTIYGTFCVVGRTQGIAILLNRFFTTAINAAYGIGNQVVGQLSFLSVALTTAINPQIVKAEGAGNRARVFRLAEISAKYSFLLISIILVPVYVYIDTLLSLWLKEVPPHTALFCKWMIIISVIDWTTQSLNTVNTAIGNVRKYNLVVSTILILTIPFAYIALKILPNASVVMVIYAFFTLISAISRLVFLHLNVGLSIRNFCVSVLGSALPIVIVNYVVCSIISNFFEGWLFLITCIISVIITIIGILTIGLNPDERPIIDGIINKIRRR